MNSYQTRVTKFQDTLTRQELAEAVELLFEKFGFELVVEQTPDYKIFLVKKISDCGIKRKYIRREDSNMVKKNKLAPDRIKYFTVTGSITVRATLLVEADSENEAIDIAEGRSGEEWMSQGKISSEDVEVDYAVED